MNATDKIFALAVKHLGQGTMESSARLCLSDARELPCSPASEQAPAGGRRTERAMVEFKVGDEVCIINNWGRVVLTGGWRITGETKAFWLVSLSYASPYRFRKQDGAQYPQYSPEPRFLRPQIEGVKPGERYPR